MQRDAALPDVGNVLGAAEAASPVESVEAVTRELGLALGSSAVSFLIADMSGRALVRLAHMQLDTAWGTSHVDLTPGERRVADESATVMPFDGGPAEAAVRTQKVQVLAPAVDEMSSESAGHWRVLAPVTERGEIIGLLELYLPEKPQGTLGEIARLATCWPS